MSNNTSFKQIINYLDAAYPTSLAENWDQVGLHFGHPDRPVGKLLVALDVRPATVEEALNIGADSMIVHHPPIFSPIQRFDLRRTDIEMYAKIIKADMNIFALHTNFDIATNGMNDWLAQALNLESIGNLEATTDSADSQPSLGRLGIFPQALSRQEVFEKVKAAFETDHLRIIEKNPKSFYQKVAIVGGAGFSQFDQVLKSEADIFITGDITFHKGQDAYEEDLMTIDAGHYIEHLFSQRMADQLTKQAQTLNWDVEVLASQVSTDPFKLI